VELPMGRAFAVRSGITSMLQLATPYASDEDIEGSLDKWVKMIKGRTAQRKVKWIRKQPDGGGQETEVSGTTAAIEPAVAPKEKGKGKKDSAADATGKYDINALKKGLLEKGMPESLLNLLSPADIVENAKSMGVIK